MHLEHRRIRDLFTGDLESQSVTRLKAAILAIFMLELESRCFSVPGFCMHIVHK
jgi:hypothetical protein